MKYQALGNTGLYVSNITLGTMTFASRNSTSPRAQTIGATGQDVATRMVDLSIEAGVNMFDTANVYGDGDSEVMLGKALGNRRKDVVIATKVFNPFGSKPNDLGTSRVAIMREVEGSLRRLGTDWIDLYQVHGFDVTTPLEETLRALNDLVRQGKVRYIGLSNFTAWQIAKADGLAHRLGTERFCSVQAYYSLVGRELEREIVPASIDLGLGILVFSPLASGFLTGKYTRAGEAEGRRTHWEYPPVNKERGFAILDVLQQVSADRGVSVAQLAVAWLLHKKGVTSVIVGATKEEQLTANLAAATIALSEDDMATLDHVSALAPEYPHYVAWMQTRGVDIETMRKSLVTSADRR